MELKKAKNDFGLMLVLFVLSVLFFTVIIPGQIPLKSVWGADTTFTSRTFPNLLSIGMIIMSVIGMISSGVKIYRLKKLSTQSDQPDDAREPVFKRMIPYIAFLLILLYGVLFAKIGYIGATILVPPLLLYILGCRKKSYYLVVYIFAVVVYVLFRFVLQVVVP